MLYLINANLQTTPEGLGSTAYRNDQEIVTVTHMSPASLTVLGQAGEHGEGLILINWCKLLTLEAAP